MSPRTVRRMTALFFVIYTVAVTWPGAIPFNRIRPLVFGLPPSLTWMALWVGLAFFVLLFLDRSETREEDRTRRDSEVHTNQEKG